MNCPNCNSSKWKNVDEFRIKPEGMHICEECGFITYPEKWKKKDEILAHYRKSYRPPPTHFNIFAGERKNHFHHAFLYDLFNKWKKEGNEEPVICEIGAAFGFTLQWIRQLFPKAKIYGTELTTSMRRVAFHEYGIRLDEDFDDTIKYDLIMSYKVLEHQLDPQIELFRYQKALKTDGHLYISVPTWFDTMSNFGAAGFDLEYYYDPNHINVWTRNIFEGLLGANGLKIEKKDYVIYSSTYLCSADSSLIGNYLPHKDNVEKTMENLEKVKNAFLLFTKNQYKEAIAIWPDYPTAHTQLAEISRKELKDKGWDEFKKLYIIPFIEQCPNSADCFMTATDFAMRAEQWHEAIKYCEAALKAKPENPMSLHHMANIMRELALRGKNQEEKMHYWNQAREVTHHLRKTSSQHFREATDLMFLFHAQVPFNNEEFEIVEPQKVIQKGHDHAQFEASL